MSKVNTVLGLVFLLLGTVTKTNAFSDDCIPVSKFAKCCRLNKKMMNCGVGGTVSLKAGFLSSSLLNLIGFLTIGLVMTDTLRPEARVPFTVSRIRTSF